MKLKGFIYIASAFENINYSKCGGGKGWVDNDPHFWTGIPTWGICRNDLRKRAEVDDYVFFVLPKHSRHPQMIFAYMKIQEIVTHKEAYHRINLRDKRMGNKKINGNIIVDANGNYNRYDAGAHLNKFDKIKERYAIGYKNESRMLNEKEILKLYPDFIKKLKQVLGGNGKRPIDYIQRYGQTLSPKQINQFLNWINS